MFLENLTSLVNLFLSGQALKEFGPFMSSASLVPLLKKDGKSIRPIAVGEVFRRLISKCCLKSVSSEATKYLKPIQLGVGVPNGTEAILHSFNRIINEESSLEGPSDKVMAFVDFSNAFNSVDRETFIMKSTTYFPQYLLGFNTLMDQQPIYFVDKKLFLQQVVYNKVTLLAL